MDHPEAGYNLITAPHLRSAYELDESLIQFSIVCEKDGKKLETEADLVEALFRYRIDYFEKLALYEFDVLNVPESLELFRLEWAKHDSKVNVDEYIPIVKMSRADLVVALKDKILFRKPDYKRYSRVLVIEKAVKFMVAFCKKTGISNFESQVNEFTTILNDINLIFFKEFDADKAVIFEQIKNRARYLMAK
jgi:glycogen debranching enzyme